MVCGRQEPPLIAEGDILFYAPVFGFSFTPIYGKSSPFMVQ
jgi:hypothetical protein